jgi:hypothetical protein
VTVPSTADALTPAWIADRLRAGGLALPVEPTVHAERIGTGLVGQSVRLALGWPEAVDAPASLVAKLPSPDPTSRATGVGLRNYEREVRFYKEVAAATPVRLARCWAAELDAATGDFVLLLEDLAPGEVGDQMCGCSLGQAEVVIDVAAGMHTAWWDHPRLSGLAEWMSVPADAERAEQLRGLWSMAWPMFLVRHGDRLGPDAIGSCERFGASIAAWVQARSGPFTLTHGDFRVDNMMFGTTPEPWMVPVDWQTPAIGPGIGDVAYFLGASLQTEDRRSYEERLVRRWHDAVAAVDPDYSWDRCWRDYRFLAFGGLVMAVAASMLTQQTARGDEMFFTMATRHLTAAQDLRAHDLL